MVRVNPKNKIRLNELKQKSYDAAITLMLDYFDITGINPRSRIISASAEIKERTERIIKILNAYERDYFKEFKTQVEIIQNYTSNSSLKFENNDINTSGDFTEKEVEEIIQINKNLSKEVETLRKEKELNKNVNIDESLKLIPKEEIENKMRSILETLKEVESKFSKSNVESGKLLIGESYINQKIRFIKQEINFLID